MSDQAVDDLEQEMGAGEHSAPMPSAFLKGLEALTKRITFRKPDGLSAFNQDSSEMPVSLSGMSVTSFARRLIVSGADADPRSKVLRIWETCRIIGDLESVKIFVSRGIMQGPSGLRHHDANDC